ncbi:MAG: hypothetical protein SCK57_07885 [Bacillota bacterium]|nr:hypothetical protein [Bacillota bacterium]
MLEPIIYEKSEEPGVDPPASLRCDRILMLICPGKRQAFMQ